ncbi:T-cell surface glycoprotein CD3 gamma chain-like [Gastrophryne carolinensis]
MSVVRTCISKRKATGDPKVHAQAEIHSAVHAPFSFAYATVCNSPTKGIIEARKENDVLRLTCPFDFCTWELDGNELETKNKKLNLSLWDDPRGLYTCKDTRFEEADHVASIEVFVRKCQNCIEMDAWTICGFIIADVIMIGLIAMAVSFVSGSGSRRPFRASDKQNLIENDAEYQPLGPRQNDPYSQLAPRTKRGAI